MSVCLNSTNGPSHHASDVGGRVGPRYWSNWLLADLFAPEIGVQRAGVVVHDHERGQQRPAGCGRSRRRDAHQGGLAAGSPSSAPVFLEFHGG